MKVEAYREASDAVATSLVDDLLGSQVCRQPRFAPQADNGTGYPVHRAQLDEQADNSDGDGDGNKTSRRGRLDASPDEEYQGDDEPDQAGVANQYQTAGNITTLRVIDHGLGFSGGKTGTGDGG